MKELMAYLPVIKHVLLNPIVIGTAIVCILFMRFAVYVANYTKKPPKPKKKKQEASKPAPVAAPTTDEESAETNPDDSVQ